MAIVQDDLLALADIQTHIQGQQAQLQAQLVEARKELEDQQVRRATVQKAMTEKRSDLAQAQTWLGYKEQDVRSAVADLEHSRGTSLEEGKLQALAAATEARDKAKYESAQLVTLLESDALAERNFTEQIEALAARLEQLSHAAGELAATHERFSAEQVSAIKALGEEALASVRAERERLAEALAQAETYYDRCLRETGQKLVAVSERAALDFLTEHIRVEDPPGVADVQAQVERAKEAKETAERSRAQSGDDVLPTIQGYGAQVTTLLARVEEVRRQHRQHAARALLRALSQPAPVPDDLALAQQLHAQAQVQPVVVEEAAPAPGPVKQRYAPQSGIRAFAPAGAVPTPAPSILHPRVKE